MVRILSEKAIETIGSQRKFLGIRLSAWIEMLIFYLVTLAIVYVLGGSKSFFGLCPHPFWIAVILISCQYGTTEGLMSALIASLLLLLLFSPARTILEDHYAYAFTLMKVPIMWFVAAVILGELRKRHIRERDQLKVIAVEAKEREETIVSAYTSLKTIKERLETRLATEMGTALMAYEAFKQMEGQSLDLILKGAQELVEAFIEPEKFSIFLLKKDQLVLFSSVGWKEDDPFSTKFDERSSLFQRIIGEQEIASVVNIQDRALLGNEGIVAVPIIDPQSTTLMGMIKIEQIHFMHLHSSAVETLRMIGSWIGAACTNFLNLQDAEAHRFIDKDTATLTPQFLAFQQDFLARLGERLKINISLLHVSLQPESECDDREVIHIITQFREAITGVLRKVDQVFHYERKGLEFAIILIGTKIDQTQVVREKVTQAITKKLGEDCTLSFRAVALHEE